MAKAGKSKEKGSTIDIGLGYYEEIFGLFDLGDESMRLEDAITFIFCKTLERDLFYGSWAQAYRNGNGEYRLKITSPQDDVSAYERLIPSYIAAGKQALGAYYEKVPAWARKGWKFLLPFGLAMANVKSIQLLHFPPLETFTYRDYLYSPTNRRWECLLAQNGFSGAGNTPLERIVDVEPIAAPGGAGSELAAYNLDFVDYALAQLRTFLRPLEETRHLLTQPVVAYGGPVYSWLKTAFFTERPRTEAEKFNAAAFKAFKNHVPGTLDVLLLKILPGEEAPSTWVLCANHPSQYLYDTGIPLRDAEKPVGEYGAPIDIMCQDLVAAGWQARMSEHPAEDGRTVLSGMMERWGLNKKSKGIDKANAQKVALVKGVMQEQNEEFCLDNNTFTPKPEQARAKLFAVRRSRRSAAYRVYAFDPAQKEVFTAVEMSTQASYDSTRRLIQVGGYLLDCSAVETEGEAEVIRYRLVKFDRNSGDPLAERTQACGTWPKEKFFGNYRPDFGAPFAKLELIGFAGYVLSIVPAEGRRTYQLWNFDPSSKDDCLSAGGFQQGGFRDIPSDRELYALDNYVLDRKGSSYRVWSFDPQASPPLALPVISQGHFRTIGEDDAMATVGSWVVTWQPKNPRKGCRIWSFDPARKNPLGEQPVKTVPLPRGFDGESTLFGVIPAAPVSDQTKTTPGTIEFMQKEIKHVVYYMLESRSFDNVLGWLYESGQKEGLHFIGGGRDGYRGLDPKMKNKLADGKDAFVSKYQNGKLSNAFVLGGPAQDPWHDNSDVILQMFHGHEGYERREPPKMNGFAWNQNSGAVMSAFTKEQLSVLNGLAQNFAVSDDWFGSAPGGTDVNRGFSVSGSAYNRLGTWEGGKAYEDWPDTPHRQSIWKVLWSHGHRDFKIYYNILWQEAVFSHQLYLSGLIGEVDAAWAQAVARAKSGELSGELPNSQWIAPYLQFKQDVKDSCLPKFSYIEPAWVGAACTSYHPGSGPSGVASLVPGEKALSDIYETLRSAKEIWPHTLLVVTFDKNGGLFDHVPPPYAKKPWPHDQVDGFEFDLLGPRVPAVMASPWIKAGTVLRAGKGAVFDSTSFAATLLDWYGIPRGMWGLGDRITSAVTFEKVFSETKVRTDSPQLKVPYDKDFPKTR